MAGKKGGENSRKVAGNARKADAAAAKKASADAAAEANEGKKWQKGAKDNSKADTAAAKAEEAARKKAEKAALLAADEAALPTKKPGSSKGAQKKNVGRPAGSGLDSALGSFDKPSAISASGIDNALDALTLTSGADEKVDRHPERRFKAAYGAFEERRLAEMADDKGLRRQQKIELIRKEFEKSEENPFNKVSARYDMSKEELKELKESERRKVEERLAEGGPSK